MMSVERRGRKEEAEKLEEKPSLNGFGLASRSNWGVLEGPTFRDVLVPG